MRDVRYGSLADIGEEYQGCPLYPRKRTCSSSGSMSAMCHKRTWLVAFVPLGGHPHERKEEMSMQRKLALDKMNSREEINRR